MTEKTILLICREPDVAREVVWELERAGGAAVWTVAGTDEAIVVAVRDEPDVVFVHVRGTADWSTVDELLWAGSTARRPAPVVVVSEQYDEAEALTFFRMGVTDYLSLDDHRDTLSRLAAGLSYGVAAVTDDARERSKDGRKPSPALALARTF